MEYRRSWDGLDSASSLDADLPLASALVAREAVLSDDRPLLREFSNHVFGLWSGWDEAVGTALLSDWTAPLDTEGRLASDAVHGLKQEIKRAHHRLQPLWRRRTGGLVTKNRRVDGQRLLMLETPCREHLTLRDLLADRTLPDDRLLDQIPSDPRLARLLSALAEDEYAVVLALSLPGVRSWAEAAESAGIPAPAEFGERVRRKTRRLAAEQRRREAQRRPYPTLRT